jgi:DNA repair exonuclease SbcCD ATPase subunit
MITKEQLSQYTYLEQAIKTTKKEIERLEKHPPVVEYDKVYGSSSEFPYTVRSFTVSGYNGTSADKWNERIRKLERKLKKQLSELEELKMQIEEFIAEIPKEKALEQLIFKYIYVYGMSQTEVAMKLRMDQSNVSRKITDYLKMYNESCI